MLAELRRQVAMLEAACQRALAAGDDAQARRGLIRALIGFKPDWPPDAPLLTAGLLNVVHARAEILQGTLDDGDQAAIDASLGRLCRALNELGTAIDGAAPQVA
jgi:hypothetical protein